MDICDAFFNNDIETMMQPLVVAKWMCRIISFSCLCWLKSGRNHWFWRQKRFGQIRVEFLNIFRPFDLVKGVSLEALESVLLSINPWSTDDYFLDILLSMVATIDTKIDAGVVRALRPLPRAYRCYIIMYLHIHTRHYKPLTILHTGQHSVTSYYSVTQHSK